MEDEGLVLGEIGEAKGRRMEAGKGVGLLGKKEEDLLNLRKEKKGCFWCGNALGFRPFSGMPRTLELYSHCPLLSGIGRMKREKGERSLRWRKLQWKWFSRLLTAGSLSDCLSCSLSLPTEGRLFWIEGRTETYMRRSYRYARWEFEINGVALQLKRDGCRRDDGH